MMKTGEVAERAQTPTSTIRYYERIGLLPAPPRESGQRIYDGDIAGVEVGFKSRAAGNSFDEKLERRPPDTS